MNKTTEALKLAGKALGCSQQHLDLYHPEWVITRRQNDEALAAIREALAQPVKQEPVEWHVENVYERGDKYFAWIGDGYVQIFTAPVSAKREWVELTDDEIDKLLDRAWDVRLPLPEFASTVIAAFKEKNK